MRRTNIITGMAAIFMVLGFMGASDLDAQERAEEYAQETRAAARADAQRLARELRMRGALDDGLSSPMCCQ